MIHDEYIQEEEARNSLKGIKASCSAQKSDTVIRAKQIFYKDIAPGITGIARIIKYTNSTIGNMIEVDNTKKNTKMITMNPRNLTMTALEEGEFKNGKKDGYCRVIHDDSSCETGFFKKDEPWGKFEWHLNTKITT
jgi:hypothetical protein